MEYHRLQLIKIALWCIPALVGTGITEPPQHKTLVENYYVQIKEEEGTATEHQTAEKLGQGCKLTDILPISYFTERILGNGSSLAGNNLSSSNLFSIKALLSAGVRPAEFISFLDQSDSFTDVLTT